MAAVNLGKEVWGESDCITFALPELKRKEIVELARAKTSKSGAKAAIKSAGSLKRAWQIGLDRAGYERVKWPFIEGDRVLGKAKIYGWTVGVYIDGAIWVRCEIGKVRAVLEGDLELWRKCDV